MEEHKKWFNGSASILKSNLFIFFAGQFVAFSCWFIFAAVTYGRLAAQFGDILEWRGRTDSRLERIDSDGTRSEKFRVEAEKLALANNETRIRYLEEQERKIDVMSEKISRIDESLKEIREQQPHK